MSRQNGQINPFVQISLNGNAVHKSQVLKRTPNPVFESSGEFLVTNRVNAILRIQVKNDNSLATGSSLGHVSVKLSDLLLPSAKEKDWYPLGGTTSGRIRISAEWKPVLMAGLNSSGSYRPPIGVVRLW